MLSLPCLQGRFPFRLGATSYVLPADVEPNVRALAGFVDDIEIVFFESEDACPLPDLESMRTLRLIAETHALSYTVHLPLNLCVGSPDEGARDAAVRTCRRIISHANLFDPFAFILHLDKPGEPIPSYASLQAWRRRTADSVSRLLPKGVSPKKICIENLDYPFEWVSPLVEEMGLSICFDVGHLLLTGESPIAFLDTYGPKIRVVHLHGVKGTEDHVPVSCLAPTLLQRLYTQLSCDPSILRVVTLEVFDAEHLRESMRTMEKLIR